jgi:hypothetical protein
MSQYRLDLQTRPSLHALVQSFMNERNAAIPDMKKTRQRLLARAA